MMNKGNIFPNIILPTMIMLVVLCICIVGFGMGCAGPEKELGVIKKVDRGFRLHTGLGGGWAPYAEITFEDGSIWHIWGVDYPRAGSEAKLRWSLWPDSRGYIVVNDIEYGIPRWYRGRVKKMFNKW